MGRAFCTEISSLKIWYLMTRATWEWPIWELREFGTLTMPKTPLAHQDTWVSFIYFNIYSSRGYVQIKSWSRCWLFRYGRNWLRVHVRKETLHRKNKKGNQRPHSFQISSNKKEWGPTWVVTRSSWLHKQTNLAQTDKPSGPQRTRWGQGPYLVPQLQLGWSH